MKKGPLSNEEKKHIEKNLDTEIADLAESMDRSFKLVKAYVCLLYTSPSPRDAHESRMPSSA